MGHSATQIKLNQMAALTSLATQPAESKQKVLDCRLQPIYAEASAFTIWEAVRGWIMSDLFEDTPTKELSWLLRQIEEREIALPDFQRESVWEPAATQELIVSIGNNYPAGSLLAIRNTHSYFAAREFEEAPTLNGSKPTYLTTGPRNSVSGGSSNPRRGPLVCVQPAGRFSTHDLAVTSC
jgi:hypothetical protein